MRDILTFKNAVAILLNHKKKSYTQADLIDALFSMYDQYSEDYNERASTVSKWCSGKRPLPVRLSDLYWNDDGRETMREEFSENILPNILNVPKAISDTKELLADSIAVLGKEKYEELVSETDPAEFFTNVYLYIIHRATDRNEFQSPSLANRLLSNKCPSPVRGFMGRDKELAECEKALKKEKTLFINGMAGIGKSEFIKAYVQKYGGRYKNVIYFYYDGDLKECITRMMFSNEDLLKRNKRFEKHYEILKSLEKDSLVLIDNYDRIHSEDPLFTEFAENNFTLLVASRYMTSEYPSMELTAISSEADLRKLFLFHCEKGISEYETIDKIIKTVYSHTMTVILAALTMKANGMTAKEMLEELEACSLEMPDQDDVEIKKDGRFSEDIMRVHLRKLWKLQRLTEEEKYIIRHLALMPEKGIRKPDFKRLMKLNNTNAVNRLINRGIIMGEENGTVLTMHPLIREITRIELRPSITACYDVFSYLNSISRVAGADVKTPDVAIDIIMSVAEGILCEEGDHLDYLRYLQDIVMILTKYNREDRIPRLLEMIKEELDRYPGHDVCDEALYLDTQAVVDRENKDYAAAAEKITAAIKLVESEKAMMTNVVRGIDILSNLYSNLSLSYSLADDMEKAKEFLKRALQIRFESRIPELLESADMIAQVHNYVFLNIKCGCYDHARTFIEDMKNRLKKENGLSAVYANFVFLEGMVETLKKNYKKARALYSDAYDIFLRQLGPNADETVKAKEAMCMIDIQRRLPSHMKSKPVVMIMK